MPEKWLAKRSLVRWKPSAYDRGLARVPSVVDQSKIRRNSKDCLRQQSHFDAATWRC